MSNKQLISTSLAFVIMLVILVPSGARTEPESHTRMLQARTGLESHTRMLQARTGLESKEEGFKKNSDGVIIDTQLESLLQDMIETTRKVLHKSSTVGHSEMVKQCAKEFSFSLENLNKAMDLYRKGLKDEDGFKELTALVTEAAKSYKRCDKAFADEYKPSPFSVYDTWLYNLAKNTEKQSDSDAERA